MIQKSRGIVLHHIKYSENSVVAYIYTEEFGRQTYMVHGIGTKSRGAKISLLQPFSLVDMTIFHKAKNTIQQLKDISLSVAYQTIPFEVRKSTIALFLAEVLYKTLYEETPNPELFEFLWTSIQYFDLKDQDTSDFHLFFLLYLTRHLGFFPLDTHSQTHQTFDLLNGSFTNIPPLHFHYLSIESSTNFYRLLASKGQYSFENQVSNSTRIDILNNLIQYYQLHIEGLKQINSLAVLHEVFTS